MPNTVIDEVLSLSRRLQIALVGKNEIEITRFVRALHTKLASNLQGIFDERVLAEAVRVLKQYYGDEPDAILEDVHKHLELVSQIHDRLHYVLNLDISLEALLYSKLNQWPKVNGHVECNFDPAVSQKLAEIRQAKTSHSQKLTEFFNEYLHHIGKSGNTEAANTIGAYIFIAIDAYERLQAWKVQGLFAIADQADVLGIRLSATAAPNKESHIMAFDTLGLAMSKAAQQALACAQTINSRVQNWSFRWDIERDDVAYDGNSIGLALTLGLLSEVEGIQIDSYTAFTGRVNWSTPDGTVQHIDYLPEKIQAAKDLGIRRVFIPRDNELKFDTGNLEVIRVSSVSEAFEKLRNQGFGKSVSPLSSQIQHLTLLLSQHNIHMVGNPLEKPDQKLTQLRYTDRIQEATVNIYTGQRGLQVQVGGSPGTNLKRVVENAKDEVFGKPVALSGPTAPKTYMVHEIFNASI